MTDICHYAHEGTEPQLRLNSNPPSLQAPEGWYQGQPFLEGFTNVFFVMYKTPLPPHVMDPSLPITEGEEGLFGGLPSNKPTKVLIRAYMVKVCVLHQNCCVVRVKADSREACSRDIIDVDVKELERVTRLVARRQKCFERRV
ncbi:hypothetical protein TNCV_1537521 [Trichonephila clavipes]|nr:hypothetical protein TNCV_1537521 [Trichonephila clavipes]